MNQLQLSTPPIPKYVAPEEQVLEAAEVESETFLLTVMDDGPDIHAQPDKLWMSRAEFQRQANQKQRSFVTPELSDIFDGLSRLSLFDKDKAVDEMTDGISRMEIGDAGISSTLTDATMVPSRPFTNCVLNPRLKSSIVDDSSPLDGQVITPSPIPELPKFLTPKRQGHVTEKVMKVLDAVEIKISKYREELLDEAPTSTSSKHFDSYISDLRTLLGNVMREIPMVIDRKKHLVEMLDDLTNLWLRKTILLPESAHGPVAFNSG
jgi:hypothetical protein